MQTKWGTLSDLDLADVRVLEKILQWDKHSQLEGMIMEHIFDQITEKAGSHGLKGLDVYTGIATNYRGLSYAFVWLTTGRLDAPIRKYLSLLSKIHKVYLVVYDDFQKEFMVSASEYDPERKDKYEKIPLQELMEILSGKKPDFLTLKPKKKEVVDASRQHQVFWGFLNVVSGDQLYRNIVLPRLFMNFGINPYFYVTDVDRVVSLGEDILVLEIKHKYPGYHNDEKKSYMGLNKNVCENIKRLLEAGFKYYYLVMIKPFSKKEIPSMYLLGDLEARDKTFFAGCSIDMDRIGTILSAKPVPAPPDTSHSGWTPMDVQPVFYDMFRFLCPLNYPVSRIGEIIAKAVKGESFPVLTDEDVRSRKMKPRFYG